MLSLLSRNTILNMLQLANEWSNHFLLYRRQCVIHVAPEFIFLSCQRAGNQPTPNHDPAVWEIGFDKIAWRCTRRWIYYTSSIWQHTGIPNHQSRVQNHSRFHTVCIFSLYDITIFWMSLGQFKMTVTNC